jgi:hypothetical protein
VTSDQNKLHIFSIPFVTTDVVFIHIYRKAIQSILKVYEKKYHLRISVTLAKKQKQIRITNKDNKFMFRKQVTQSKS